MNETMELYLTAHIAGCSNGVRYAVYASTEV